MSHKSNAAVAEALDYGADVPYTLGMRNERETMPPGPADAEAREFEKACEREGEYWARARNAAKRVRP